MRYKSQPPTLRGATTEVRTEALRPAPRSGRRRRDWFATIPIIVLLPALLMPLLSTEAAAPTIGVSGSLYVGAVLTVVGSHFPGESRVEVLWDDVAVSNAIITTSPSGAFERSFTVPAAATVGAHSLGAVATADGGSADVASASITIFVTPHPQASRAGPGGSGRATRSVPPSMDPSSVSGPGAAEPTSTPNATPAAPVSLQKSPAVQRSSTNHPPKSQKPSPKPRPSAPKATATPTPKPATGPVSSLNVRPFVASSWWNTPAAGTVDPNSKAMIATISGTLSSDPTQYSYPVYVADSNTPRHDISCRKWNCTVVTADGTTTSSVLRGVPIPDGARPSAGTDGQMIVIDRSTGAEYDLWQVQRDGSNWSVSNGSVYNIHFDGMPTRYGSRGAGVPYLAGLIRPWEIAVGSIDHAIAFAYPAPAAGRCVAPASKTDGGSGDAMAIPEGARLQLDPILTDADFSRMGLDRTGRIIARALQRYGMIVVDRAGRPKIYAEDVTANPLASLGWSTTLTKLTSNTVAGIPIQALRVMKLPAGYWSGGGAMHGDCHT